MKIMFWEENYYFKRIKYQYKKKIRIPRTFILYYQLTTQACCLTSATEGKISL